MCACLPAGNSSGAAEYEVYEDINSFFGQYQAGADSETPAPQVSYKQNDPEANSAVEGREQHV